MKLFAGFFNWLYQGSKIRLFLYQNFTLHFVSVKPFISCFLHGSQGMEKKAKKEFERLEFLGDAVIDLVIRDLLMKVYPSAEEGSLTKIKAQVVSRKELGRIANVIKLPKLVRVDPRIDVQQTSIFGNALEAIVGQLFLLKGYEKTDRVLKQFFSEHIAFDQLKNQIFNFKGVTIEWAQKNKKKWELEIQELPKNRYLATLFIDQQIQTVGVSSSKKSAEQKACRIFWEINEGY